MSVNEYVYSTNSEKRPYGYKTEEMDIIFHSIKRVWNSTRFEWASSSAQPNENLKSWGSTSSPLHLQRSKTFFMF